MGLIVIWVKLAIPSQFSKVLRRLFQGFSKKQWKKIVRNDDVPHVEQKDKSLMVLTLAVVTVQVTSPRWALMILKKALMMESIFFRRPFSISAAENSAAI